MIGRDLGISQTPTKTLFLKKIAIVSLNDLVAPEDMTHPDPDGLSQLMEAFHVFFDVEIGTIFLGNEERGIV